MRCKGIVDKGLSRYGSGRHVGNCSKKAKHFFRVTYREMTQYYRSRRGRMDDSFGFCDECSAAKERPDGWAMGYKAGCVYRLCGPVDTVATCDEADVAQGMADNGHAELKARVRTIMQTAKYSKVEPEAWSRLFEDLVEEMIVHDVQSS